MGRVPGPFQRREQYKNIKHNLQTHTKIYIENGQKIRSGYLHHVRGCPMAGGGRPAGSEVEKQVGLLLAAWSGPGGLGATEDQGTGAPRHVADMLQQTAGGHRAGCLRVEGKAAPSRVMPSAG